MLCWLCTISHYAIEDMSDAEEYCHADQHCHIMLVAFYKYYQLSFILVFVIIFGCELWIFSTYNNDSLW